MKQEIIRKLSAAVAMSLVVGVSLAACGAKGGAAAPPLPARPRPALPTALAVLSPPP